MSEELEGKLSDMRILDREAELRQEREADEREEYELQSYVRHEAIRQNLSDLREIFRPGK